MNQLISIPEHLEENDVKSINCHSVNKFLMTYDSIRGGLDKIIESTKNHLGNRKAMARIEISFNKFIDLKNGSISTIEGIGSWDTLIDLVKNTNNRIFLTTVFEGIVAILYFDAEKNDIKARLLEVK